MSLIIGPIWSAFIIASIWHSFLVPMALSHNFAESDNEIDSTLISLGVANVPFSVSIKSMIIQFGIESTNIQSIDEAGALAEIEQNLARLSLAVDGFSSFLSKLIAEIDDENLRLTAAKTINDVKVMKNEYEFLIRRFTTCVQGFDTGISATVPEESFKYDISFRTVSLINALDALISLKPSQSDAQASTPTPQVFDKPELKEIIGYFSMMQYEVDLARNYVSLCDAASSNGLRSHVITELLELTRLDKFELSCFREHLIVECLLIYASSKSTELETFISRKYDDRIIGIGNNKIIHFDGKNYYILQQDVHTLNIGIVTLSKQCQDGINDKDTPKIIKNCPMTQFNGKYFYNANSLVIFSKQIVVSDKSAQEILHLRSVPALLTGPSIIEISSPQVNILLDLAQRFDKPVEIVYFSTTNVSVTDRILLYTSNIEIHDYFIWASVGVVFLFQAIFTLSYFVTSRKKKNKKRRKARRRHRDDGYSLSRFAQHRD